MVKAYPTDQKGNRVGPTKSFSNDHWARLKTVKPFRWAEEPSNKVAKKPIELVSAVEPEKPKTQEPEMIIDKKAKKKPAGKRKRVTNKNK